MITEIVVAVIVAGGGAITQIVIAKSTTKTHAAVTDVKLEAIKEDMANLTVDVKKHNNFMERVAVLETKDANILTILTEIKETCKDNRKSCVTIIRNQNEN